MKLQFAAFFLASLALSGFLLAQSDQPEWTIEKMSGNAIGQYSGGEAKWKISGKPLSDVYTAFMQNLSFIRDTKAEGDISSGTITARRTGALIHLVLSEADSGATVQVIGRWEFVPGEKMQMSTPFVQAKKFFNELFPKVKEALSRLPDMYQNQGSQLQPRLRACGLGLE